MEIQLTNRFSFLFFTFLFFLGSFLIVAQPSYGQSGGINFKGGDWDEILSLAGVEKKIIFVDAYTTWCGPCKQMTKQVFPQSKVGDFFNKHFINVKMDMEKGEGVDLAKQYSVNVYPSLLFLAEDGTLIHRSAGFHDVSQFIELGETALDPSRRLSALDDRYVSGDRRPDFLYNYTLARFEIQDGSHSSIAEEYLNTQNNWSSEENMQFLYSFVGDTDSKMYEYLISNKDKFIALFWSTGCNCQDSGIDL